MKFASRLWEWLRALFGVRTATEFAYDDGAERQEVRSANICFASTGATRRERSNAESHLYELRG